MASKKKDTAYVVRPTEKKSICAKYLIIETLEDGDTKWFNVDEHYRWGRGFITDKNNLPKATDEEVICDFDVGSISHNLDDGVATWFEFDELYDEDDQDYIRTNYNEGDDEGHSQTGWLFEGSHGRNFDIEECSIVVTAPFEVDLIDINTGEVIEANIKLKGKKKS